jgi:hypothetical protein
MLVMAPKKSGAKKKANRAGRAVTLWLSLEAFSALEKWRKSQPVAPIRTDIIEQALVEFLAKNGVVTEYPDDAD